MRDYHHPHLRGARLLTGFRNWRETLQRPEVRATLEANPVRRTDTVFSAAIMIGSSEDRQVRVIGRQGSYRGGRRDYPRTRQEVRH